MRLVFFILIIDAIAQSWYQMITDDSASAIAIFGSIAGVATGLKLVQKYQEKNKDVQ